MLVRSRGRDRVGRIRVARRCGCNLPGKYRVRGF